MIARKSLVALSLGLCLLTSCVVQRPAAAEPPRLPSESVAASVGASAAASAPPPSVAASPPPASAAPLASAPASRPALPKQLLIPAIHVDAPVERVGTTPEGAMDVPREWNDVGWFEKGYRPGERGSAVIAGHLDSTTDRAVFWDLNKLQPGDKVVVKGEDGSERTFQVVGSEIYVYYQAPLDRIFGPAGAPMLNLVTCNGTFDRGAKNYDKRLVVYTKEVASR